MQLGDFKRRAYLGVIISSMGALAGCPTTDETTDNDSSKSPESTQARDAESVAGAFEISETTISEATTTVGEPLEITVLISNTGDVSGDFDVRLSAGQITKQNTVTLAPAEETQIGFSPVFEDSGRFTISINETDVGAITVESRDVYHVAEDGDDSNTGAVEDSLGTIQEALQRAGPGDTVEVAPGEYQSGDRSDGVVRTVRDGESDAPITINGPEDAVLRPSLRINHSHIRLTGLTIEGLVDPQNPDDVDSFADSYPILISPPQDSDVYLEDIICSPHGVGYGYNGLIRVFRTRGLEIGSLEVTGLAGASWMLPDKQNEHAGEIIYLGSPPGIVFEDFYPWYGLDRTRDVHIHHIDNSDGHPHSELVDAKLGTEEVLIEYCTDAGGARNNESYPNPSIGLRSYAATVRWCELLDGEGHGIKITDPTDWLRGRENPAIDPEERNPENAIYGNRISGFSEKSIEIHTSAAEQGAVCGNDVSEPTDGAPTESCPAEIPDGEEIGHLGGNSSRNIGEYPQ